MKYTDEEFLEIRGAVDGEWETANFREIRAGRIAPGVLYRSSHPVDGEKQKRDVTLAAVKARIATVLNLSDTPLEMKRKAVVAPWYNAIVRAGNAVALGMDFSFLSPPFCEKFGAAVRFMLARPAPYLFHCYAGCDRTGFFAMVLEGFMGAGLDDIADDYLKSFCAFGLPPRNSPEYKNDAAVVHSTLAKINGGAEVTDGTVRGAAAAYMREKAGLSGEELERLELILFSR